MRAELCPSTWRRNPIPGCNCDNAYGECDVNASCENTFCSFCRKSYEQQDLPSWYHKHVASGGLACDSGFQFPPPAEGIYGASSVYHIFRGGKLSYSPSFRFGDELRVPNEEGEYVLQWRWDCEESAQIWASCADIQIVAPHLAV